MALDDIPSKEEKLEETIKALKDNYTSHRIYEESKQELENFGFIIMEPEDGIGIPIVVKEY